MLTLVYGLHYTLHLLHFSFIFVLLAHLHVFRIWFYIISLNNSWDSYFRINLSFWTKGKMERKWRGNTTEENIAILSHFGIHKLSIYKNSWTNDTKKKVFFFYCNGKLDLMLKWRDGALICALIIIITSLQFFPIFLMCK